MGLFGDAFTDPSTHSDLRGEKMARVAEAVARGAFAYIFTRLILNEYRGYRAELGVK